MYDFADFPYHPRRLAVIPSSLRRKTTMNNVLSEEYFEQSVIARRLKMSEKSLESWRCRGCGPPFIRVGRLIRYRWSDVEGWLDSRRMTSTSEARR
jgi:hypothetical protein